MTEYIGTVQIALSVFILGFLINIEHRITKLETRMENFNLTEKKKEGGRI